MTNGAPAGGIRRRRHEAAAAALTREGWTPSGPPDTGTQRYANSSYPDDELIVGVAGALYWVRRGRATIERTAKRQDGEAIAAALDAARRTR